MDKGDIEVMENIIKEKLDIHLSIDESLGLLEVELWYDDEMVKYEYIYGHDLKDLIVRDCD